MLSKEEFQKTYIRMMDSLRDPLDTHLMGKANCDGIKCDCCPLSKLDDGTSATCSNMTYVAIDVIEIVEQWGKEHPVLTRSDKFKEVFGREPRYHSTGGLMCPQAFTNDDMRCQSRLCDGCCEKFWNGEYIQPKED